MNKFQKILTILRAIHEMIKDGDITLEEIKSFIDLIKQLKDEE